MLRSFLVSHVVGKLLPKKCKLSCYTNSNKNMENAQYKGDLVVNEMSKYYGILEFINIEILRSNFLFI